MFQVDLICGFISSQDVHGQFFISFQFPQRVAASQGGSDWAWCDSRNPDTRFYERFLISLSASWIILMTRAFMSPSLWLLLIWWHWQAVAVVWFRYCTHFFIRVINIFLICSWFHGRITRQQAEDLLQPPEDGRFLVRESTSFPGDYTLCVSWEGAVEHYHIMYKDRKLTIDEEELFENLDHLIEVGLVIWVAAW